MENWNKRAHEYAESELAMCFHTFDMLVVDNIALFVRGDVDDDEWKEKETVFCNILSWLLYFYISQWVKRTRRFRTHIASSSTSWRENVRESLALLIQSSLVTVERDIFHQMLRNVYDDGFQSFAVSLMRYHHKTENYRLSSNWILSSLAIRTISTIIFTIIIIITVIVVIIITFASSISQHLCRHVFNDFFS